jgi:signal transduction histidine kinase
MARDPSKAHRVDEAFGTIRERLDHLSRFINGYARFARLPAPRHEAVSWRAFIDSLGEFPDLELIGSLPNEPGHFDPAQMRQVVINLLKNAYEASGARPRVSLRVDSTAEGVYLQVRDRGRGMDDETLEKALLPFYSTKQTGTGLGLPLCREIIEAHGGKISLQRGEQPAGRDGDGRDTCRRGAGTLVTCWLPRLRQ